MANKVKVKRTYAAGVVPTTAELAPHEFAVNWTDGIVYVKAPDGTIQSVTLGGSGGGGSYTLPTATSSVLGGIKVGSGLTITDGVLAATGGGGSANIVEATTAAGFPATGASSTLYVATDASRAYRWSGSVYVEIGTSGGGSAGDGTDALVRSLLVPAAPTSVTATGGNAQAVVSWTAPSVLSQTPITGYVVEWTPAGGSASTVSTGSTSTSYTKTGLTNGTAVIFRVAAVNAVGTGSYSSASSAVTPAAAAAVTYASKYGPGTHTVTGTGTITATVTGGGDSSDTRLWLLVGVSGTLSYTVTASSEGGYDGGRLYLTSSAPATNANEGVGWDQASISGLTNVSAAVSGVSASTGTASVTAGQYLVLRYVKGSEDTANQDKITAVLSIA